MAANLYKDVLEMFQQVWPRQKAYAFGSAVYREELDLPVTSKDIDIVTDVQVTRVGIQTVMSAYFDVIDFKCNEKAEPYNIPQIQKRYQFLLADGRNIDIIFTDTPSTSRWHSDLQASPLTQVVKSLDFNGNIVTRNTASFKNIKEDLVGSVLVHQAQATKEHILKLHNLAKQLNIKLQVV